MSRPDCVGVTSRSFSRHVALRDELLALYPKAKFNDTGDSLHGPAFVRFLKGCSKAITALERIDAASLAELPELRVISKYGVGLDMIDLAALQAHGVRLGWTAGVNRRSVAEMVIAAAINLLHRVPAAHDELRRGQWRQLVGRQLTGRTVGILGCGHVGKEVAVLLKAFACRVLAYDIRDYPAFYTQHGVEAVGLETLLPQSDVVTIHLPLDSSTRNFLDSKRLGAMKPGAVLINMARGGIVDEPAVASALHVGALAGAAFDVFAEEPLHDRSILDLPNVVGTPHIGGSSEEAVLAMGRAAIAGLESAVLPLEHPDLRGHVTA